MQFLEKRSASFDIRKFAALTKEKDNVFYILCGWMPEKQADAFQKEIEDDEKTFVVVEDDHDNIFSTPPTKLKNPKVFRPFEMYVKMYGLPAYNELDPTMFVALTYAFIFGAMFGDVGQGLVLLLGGLFLYKKKGMDLAAIIASAGVFSTFFGFMYGSFFGFEDTLIKHIWLKPKEAMMNLPVIGQMNTVFVVAIVFGMFLILTAMIMHIIVCVRNHDAEGTWFDTNGVAGFLFYAFLAACLFLVMSGPLPLPAAHYPGDYPGPARFWPWPSRSPWAPGWRRKRRNSMTASPMYLVQDLLRDVRGTVKLLFQYAFLCPYRRLRGQPRGHDGGGADAGRFYGGRQRQLADHRPWKRVRMRHGGPDRRHPGAEA